MRPFFFVPASKLKKIPYIQSLGVSEIIVDFEDAILKEQKEVLLKELKNTPDFANFWCRVPLRDNYQEIINTEFLVKTLNLGVKKIILPKLVSKNETEAVFEKIGAYKDLEIILLIEHPRLLLEAGKVLEAPNLSNRIYGLGIGSHDLMTFMGMEHSSKQLIFPRTQLLYLAKAYAKEAIDIASMNIQNKEEFESELLFGEENGYGAKFLIHPNQVHWIQNFDGIKVKQLSWADKILAALPEGHIGKEIEPFVLDGEIVEKPHIEKARAILEKYKD